MRCLELSVQVGRVIMLHVYHINSGGENENELESDNEYRSCSDEEYAEIK